MKSETKTCQNCKIQFTIEPDDFSFYEKIKVPPPTWCPECRLVRKLSWRNDRTLYKHKCDLCNINIISIYPDSSPLKIYCQDCWWSDKWDPSAFAFKFNSNKSFFDQFQQLTESVPVMNLFNINPVNSEYCNYAGNNKNCYLFFGGRKSENVSYVNRVFSSKDSFDLYDGNKLELCYECVQCKNSNRLFFSRLCSDCNDSWFLYDCKGCQNCFGCANLRNQNYHIFNKPYIKEEYFKKLNEFNLKTYSGIEKIKKIVEKNLTQSIRCYAHIVNSPGSTGDNLYNSKNCKNCFDITGIDSENSKYNYFAGVGVKDCYDNYGISKLEESYETLATGFESTENSRYFFSNFVKGCHDLWYSYGCRSSSYLFACIGLRNKSYCILNKQYTKEQYEELVPKIIKHMNDMPYIDSKGRIYKYGEFFPSELSPFCYNETIAQEYFPLTKEQAISQGYKWKDKEKRNYQIDIKNKDIPDDIKDITDDILGKVIECGHKGGCNQQCTEAFKIIPEELQFYQRINLPLPRLCPNCRHYERLAQRNPLKLWHRKCMKEGCTNEFETSYAPERPEIVYCEKCYQQEVY